MKSNSCVVQRLIEHDLNIVFPHKDDIECLHKIIVDELANNICTEESKEFYIKSMKRLYDEEKVEGIILGCTGNFNVTIF
jgi:aspartate racemase